VKEPVLVFFYLGFTIETKSCGFHSLFQ